VLETQRKSEKATADAELATTQTRLNMNISIAQIQATRQSEARDAELQRDVETKRADMELERRRAKDVVNAKIEREAAQQKACVPCVGSLLQTTAPRRMRVGDGG
jgi:flotillin